MLYQLISTRVTAGAASHPATKTVFVASRDLAPGALVTERDVTQQSYISVPAGAITRKEDIVNRGVIMAIHRDAPFFDGTLAKAGEGAGFATIIPPGMRAFTVKVNEVVGVAGFAVAGMHVDVLVAGTPPGAQTAGAISRTLLQNITVLSAGQNYQKDAEGKPVLVQVVNLLLTPAQAEVMNLATDQRIQLVLRNPTDEAIMQTPGAATANLFEGNSIRTTAWSFAAGATGGTSVKPKRRVDPPVAVAPPAETPTARHTSVIEVISGGIRKDVTVTTIQGNTATAAGVGQ